MDSHPIVRDAAQCQCVQRFRLQQVNCKRDGIIIIPSAPFGIRIFQASTYSVRQELYRRTVSRYRFGGSQVPPDREYQCFSHLPALRKSSTFQCKRLFYRHYFFVER